MQLLLGQGVITADSPRYSFLRVSVSKVSGLVSVSAWKVSGLETLNTAK